LFELARIGSSLEKRAILHRYGLARKAPRVDGQILDDCGQQRISSNDKYIAAADFKANCLRLMDEVALQRRAIVITKRGKPVAKLVPVENEPRDLFGYMAGTAKICDIIGPIEDLEWTGDPITSEERPLLLDTHIWIWFMLADAELAVSGRAAINLAAASGQLRIAAIRFGRLHF
jgi:prevent-host-death family protein